ncbi:TetR/AcrR family transcriptional regulator [Nocardia sp. NPDC051911]|uniref:TetR/AcrR family transcriptional regulator n=1 Tax=Nocardia sp. NPDC051911 TaxID=3154648 RepID=UPI003433EDC4
MVRTLVDAALTVISAAGTTGRPRVTDIVATAGLSNDAFYRHFPSKDALGAALLEDGAERLTGCVAHPMAKEADPRARFRRWSRRSWRRPKSGPRPRHWPCSGTPLGRAWG